MRLKHHHADLCCQVQALSGIAEEFHLQNNCLDLPTVNSAHYCQYAHFLGHCNVNLLDGTVR